MDTIAASVSFAFLLSLIVGLPCAAVGCLIASFVNGRTGAGFWAGFFLGPIGWAVAALLKDNRVTIKTRSLYSAPCVADAAAFCVACGVDGVSTVEIGVTRWACPSCGRAL